MMWSDTIAIWETAKYEQEAIELLEKAIVSENRRFVNTEEYNNRIKLAINLIKGR